MFNLRESHPTLILGGRTSLWVEEEYSALLWPFFIKLASAIISVDISCRPTVLTGATQCGIIQMFGQACEYIGQYPKALIGVAPRYCIDEMKVSLEKHHSHILLTPGKQWDQAIPFMRAIRKVIASKKPSIMLAIGGGNDTLKEMLAHAYDDVPLYVLKDGGRLSEGFMTKINNLHVPHTLHQQIQATRIVHLLELSQPEETVKELMKALGFTQKNECWK